MISIKRIHLVVCLFLLLIVSCSENATEEPILPEVPDQEEPVMDISLSILSGAKIEAADLQGKYQAIIKTNIEKWTAVCPDKDKDWCSLTQSNDTLSIFLKDNFTGVTRSTKIDVVVQQGENCKKEPILITQTGVEKTGSLHRGTLNNLVIFYRFADDPEFDKDLNYYNALLNGGEEDQPSMQDFFREASYGKLTVRSHFFPKSGSSKVLSFQSEDKRPNGGDFIWMPNYYVAQAIDALKSRSNSIT